MRLRERAGLQNNRDEKIKIEKQDKQPMDNLNLIAIRISKSSK